MPLAGRNEANESRIQAVVKKRSLATSPGRLGASAPSRQKKANKKNKPNPQGKKRRAQLLREKNSGSFSAVDNRRQFNTRKARKKGASNHKNKKAGIATPGQATSTALAQDNSIMSAESTNPRAGPLAWNQGSSGTIRTSLRGTLVPQSSLGNNRLATGFGGAPAASAPSPDSLESGETRSTPIEISSDEEEGGLLINVEGQASPEVIEIESSSDEDDEDDDEDDELEEGEEDERAVVSPSLSSPILGDRDAHMQLQGELERHLSNDFEPLSIDATGSRKPLVRLADLSADELEDQYKYCFYGLSRDQIDLQRPVVCMECLQEGHMHNKCPEKYCTSCNDSPQHSKQQCPYYRRCTNCRERGHEATVCQSKLKQTVKCDHCNSTHHVETECPLHFFPSTKPDPNKTIKLWVSCCNCASKTHLVGDCPSLHPDTAPAWSLRTLDVEQINNLSLQSGISGLEKAAENRNMRPQGRENIRPVRNRQPLNQRTTFDEDDSEDRDDSFLRPPVQRQGQKGNITFAKQASRPSHYQPSSSQRRRSPDDSDRDHARYDRYDAPSNYSPNNRSRGAYYQRDSFGRRRSRSPSPRYGGDSYRPYDQPPPQSASRRSQLSERVSYPQDSRDNRDREWQPPLPAGPPPPGNSAYAYRPAGSQGQGRKGKGHGQGQGKAKRARGGSFR